MGKSHSGKLEMDFDSTSWEQKLAELNLPGRNPKESDGETDLSHKVSLWFHPRLPPLLNVLDKTTIH